MSYKKAPPTKPPKSGGNKKVIVVFITILFLICTWQFGAKPLYEKYKDQGLLVIGCAGGNQQETKEF